MTSSSDPWISACPLLICAVQFRFIYWILTSSKPHLKQRDQHQPVNGLEDLLCWKAECLFILILPLPAWWQRIRNNSLCSWKQHKVKENGCFTSANISKSPVKSAHFVWYFSLMWSHVNTQTWQHPPSCSTVGRWFGICRRSCHGEIWRCLWPDKDLPRRCCCTKLF